MARLREIRDELDDELVRRMKEENVVEFNTMLKGEPAKVWYSREKKEKIKNTRTLENMLFDGLVPGPEDNPQSQARRELAKRALSGGQNAWKIPQVRLLVDTLGLDIIETTFGDKIKVKAVTDEILEGNK